MSKPFKPRRGTTAQHASFIGEAHEVTFDTDKNTLVAHDGKTAGGFPLAKSAELEAFKTTQATKDAQQDTAIQQAQTTADNAQTAANNAASAASGAQNSANTANNSIAALAKVATSGSYDDLSNKPTIPSTPADYIVETYRNGESWYDVYKSGKVRQGGVVTSLNTGGTATVTLLKKYKDTKFSVLPGRFEATDTNNVTASAIIIKKTTTSSFVMKNGANGGNAWFITSVSWVAEGQGA